MIEVISGVIIEKGLILLAQRPPTKRFYPMCWEMAGGKREANETHHQALGRELFEELNLTLSWIAYTSMWDGQLGQRAEGDAVDDDRSQIHLFNYLAGLHPDCKIVPKEGQGWGWFNKHEVQSLKRAPGLDHCLVDVLALMYQSEKETWLAR